MPSAVTRYMLMLHFIIVWLGLFHCHFLGDLLVLGLDVLCMCGLLVTLKGLWRLSVGMIH